MRNWARAALARLDAHDEAALVTVLATEGSAPREAGTKMVVWRGGQDGTIGGGNLEYRVADQARRMLDGGQAHFAIQDYPLGPLLGQCCGGRVRLLVERIDGESLAWLDAAARACEAGAPFRLRAEIMGGGLARSVAAAGVDTADNSPRTPIPEVRTLSETITPKRPRLVMFGAGHVAQAVARAFAPLPFHLDWLASREDLRPEAGGTSADILSEDELEACLEAAPADAFFAIFTHSHDLDYRLTRAALRRGDFRYLGLIGSATKRVRFERRLRDDGLTDTDLSRLTCPIGIPALKSKAPSVIAVALAAELLQLLEDPGA